MAGEAAQELRADTDRAARVASLRPLFAPRAVAVVGASRDPASIGGRIVRNLVDHGFAGQVYPINPRASAIGNLRCYSKVSEAPPPIDLAVIAVPHGAVLDAVADCASAGIRALIVISAGFAECGADGRALQTQLLDLVRRNGMRMVGPNCLGLINADPTVRLNASFAPVFPPAGNIAMSSQSGALGIAVLSAAHRFGLGLSSFVSVGNKADISSNDLLEYWEQDSRTEVILLYLESFGNPRRFARIARRVGRSKPIVALKSGRSRAGGRAAGSHTAALAANETAVDALFHQSGVIRAESLEELFDVASVLSKQPLPGGMRVGIVTNAGGPGILAADACEAHGLTVPPFSADLQSRLAQFLPRAAGLTNPVDMIAAATPDQFAQTIAAVADSGEIDALIVEFVAVGIARPDEVLAAIQRGRAEAATTKPFPIVACFMTGDGHVQPGANIESPIPVFEFPEAAARALGRIATYSAWQRQPLGTVPPIASACPDAREFIRGVLSERGPGWLGAAEARRLLTIAGLAVPPGGLARDESEAVALAERIGYPVAAKLASRTIVHKSDIGGVRLNLADAASVRSAFRDIAAAAAKSAIPDAFDGILVQPMVRDAVEVVAGMTHDRQFGPLLMFGLGGVHVEILGDVVFRITPLTDRDAAEMIRSIRGYRLLQGYRGHPRCDIAALEDLLLRLSGMVEGVPEIAEMDLNPVMAMADGRGCFIADVRVRITEV